MLARVGRGPKAAVEASGLPCAGSIEIPFKMRSVARLSWAKENGCPWHARNLGICSILAKCGNLEVLQWAWQNGCPWSATTCHNAAIGGHLEVLRWVRERGCPWDEWTSYGAAMGGHLDVLKWARERNCPWSETACSLAAGGGHLEVLVWLRQHGYSLDESVGINAARRGQLAVLKWASKNECPCFVEIMSWSRLNEGAIANGHLAVLIWLQEHWLQMYVDSGFDLCTCAAQYGQLEILRWAEEHYPWDVRTCRAAASAGHLEVLIFLRERGCRWDKQMLLHLLHRETSARCAAVRRWVEEN
mmetsp:Transcript_37302/g.92232  ORF Transcript_37302/g.92232 Transcript_37302/m.92232 type:complete len:302 (-) Transcript_37302:215-1120(-)